MPARTKKTATIDPNMVSITDFCQSQGINEQIFRLELMQHLDDADSLKFISPDVASSVATSLTTTQPALLPTQEIPETIAPQDLQPATETASEVPQKPQNSDMVASTPNSLNKPPAGAAIPTALTEFVAKAQDDIELFDLVQTFRNEQILANSQSRDLELVAQLREQRLENRSLVFDQLRDLNARQPIQPDLPELPPSLKDEIKALSNELGKKLSA